jgi:TolB-like protein/tetratricopeptide (TPR) repeat protein
VRYRFTTFSLDTKKYELCDGASARHVEPLVFDLLTFFVRNPGRIAGKDEIVSEVWGGRAVSDATISSCVKAARRALGDDGDAQSYIRTVRGRGFEFTADVSAVDEDPVAASSGLRPAPGPEVRLEAGRSAAGGSSKPVIAVLPFANLSAEADEYFADGLTEDIITNLCRFRDLRVVAGASTFHFKGRAVDVADLSARLGVGHVVQGSVRRAAGRVRVSVQLIDAGTGLQAWGDRYDGDMGDIFALQDEVTRTIAATLGVKVQDAALRRALTKTTVELDAYDCLLRARRYTWMLRADVHAEARDLLERAVELDPLSSDAHALLANVYLGEHRFDMNPRPNPIGRAMVHALAATQLDPQNAYARCWLGIAHFFRGENARFEVEAARALELNPNDAETLADIGHYLAFMGEFERGVELTRRAQRLNPLHPGWYHFSFARLHFSRGQYQETVTDMQRMGLPDFYWTHLLACAALGHMGGAEAASALARILDLKPDFSARAELGKWNAAPDDLEHIVAGLRKAGWDE